MLLPLFITIITVAKSIAIAIGVVMKISMFDKDACNS